MSSIITASESSICEELSRSSSRFVSSKKQQKKLTLTRKVKRNPKGIAEFLNIKKRIDLARELSDRAQKYKEVIILCLFNIL